MTLPKTGAQWRETEGLVGKDKIDLKIQTDFSNTQIYRYAMIKLLSHGACDT